MWKPLSFMLNYFLVFNGLTQEVRACLRLS